MRVTVTTNLDLSKLDIGEVTKIGLINSTSAIKILAQANAPYETGTLKKSIAIEPKTITKSTTQARVGPRDVIYAVRREYENKKNPDRKFYMKRTHDATPKIIKQEFENAVKIVAGKL